MARTCRSTRSKTTRPFATLWWRTGKSQHHQNREDQIMLRRHFLVTIGAAALTASAVSQASWAADGADAVVQAYLAAWNAHDWAKAAGFFADNVVYYDASVGKPIEGRDAAKTGVIDNFLTAVPDAVWTMKGAPVVEGDRVAFEW